MKRTAHSSTDLKYHLVIVPKYRSPIFKAQLKTIVTELIWRKFDNHHYIHVIEYAVQFDHVHIHFEARPDTSLVHEISSLKTDITNKVLKLVPELVTILGGRNLWARGYFLSTTGINSSVVSNYIQNQKS